MVFSLDKVFGLLDSWMCHVYGFIVHLDNFLVDVLVGWYIDLIFV